MRNKTKNPIQSREFLQDLWHSYNTVQLNKYETAPKFHSIKPKLDVGLFVDLAEFTCFYQFLHDLSSADQNKTIFGSQ